jgi:hypothetical protein
MLMSDRRQPLTPAQRNGLREVAAGRPWNVKDVILSDLMAKQLIKREGTERVLTHKGRMEADRLRSSSGTESLSDLFETSG